MYIDYVQCVHKEKRSVTFEALGHCVGNILVAKYEQEKDVIKVERGKLYRLVYYFNSCEHLRIKECTEIPSIPRVKHTKNEVEVCNHGAV